jgi:hypothetical protein
MTCSGQVLTDQDVSPPVSASLVRSGEALDLDTIDVDAGEANDGTPYFRFDPEDAQLQHKLSWVRNLRHHHPDAGRSAVRGWLRPGHQLYNEERVEEAVTQTMTEDLEWKWTATRKWPAGAKAAMAS